jgi:hypothetical protein
MITAKAFVGAWLDTTTEQVEIAVHGFFGDVRLEIDEPHPPAEADKKTRDRWVERHRWVHVPLERGQAEALAARLTAVAKEVSCGSPAERAGLLQQEHRKKQDLQRH